MHYIMFAVFFLFSLANFARIAINSRDFLLRLKLTSAAMQSLAVCVQEKVTCASTCEDVGAASFV